MWEAQDADPVIGNVLDLHRGEFGCQGTGDDRLEERIHDLRFADWPADEGKGIFRSWTSDSIRSRRPAESFGTSCRPG